VQETLPPPAVPPKLPRCHDEKNQPVLRLSDILTPERVRLPLPGANKEELIEGLLDVLAAEGVLSSREWARQAVLQREQTRTTGIGHGLALPHGKTAAVEDIVMAMGRTDEPVDFASVDARPVRLVILLLSPPDRTGLHIQALARISRLVSAEPLRRRLLDADSAREICDLIGQQEAQLIS